MASRLSTYTQHHPATLHTPHSHTLQPVQYTAHPRLNGQHRPLSLPSPFTPFTPSPKGPSFPGLCTSGRVPRCSTAWSPGIGPLRGTQQMVTPVSHPVISCPFETAFSLPAHHHPTTCRQDGGPPQAKASVHGTVPLLHANPSPPSLSSLWTAGSQQVTVPLSGPLKNFLQHRNPLSTLRGQALSRVNGSGPWCTHGARWGTQHGVSGRQPQCPSWGLGSVPLSGRPGPS